MKGRLIDLKTKNRNMLCRQETLNRNGEFIVRLTPFKPFFLYSEG